MQSGANVAQERVVVIGAGIGGLAAALRLAQAGLDVTVLERAAHPGGKMRSVAVGGQTVEAGPTVFTMRWVFEELFAECGARLDDRVALARADLLARHAWSRSERLDLFADIEASAAAVDAFAGPREAEGYRRFCARSAEVYRTLEGPFIRDGRTSPAGLAQRVGLSGLGDLWRIQPFATLWSALGSFFRDPRLLQLFGRYATYCGASPFSAPATLMLVAHVEQAGVWTVAGGLSALARAVADLAAERGAAFRYGAHVERIVIERGRIAGINPGIFASSAFRSFVICVIGGRGFELSSATNMMPWFEFVRCENPVAVTTPSTCGFCLATSTACCQSRTPSLPPEIVACATMPRMRLVNSFSKPFMTERTTISAITPTASPSIEINEMNEMK